MERVFRIVDANGVGMYGVRISTTPLVKLIGMGNESTHERPEPDDDDMWGMRYANERFGFANPDQLINWMDDIPLERVYQHQGKILLLEVNTILRGKKQCSFNIHDVVKTTELTLEDFYNHLY